MAICPKCGSEITAGTRFCGTCGAPVAPEAFEDAASKPASSDIPKAAGAAAAPLSAEKAGGSQGRGPAQSGSPYNYKNNYEEPAAGVRQSLREFAGSGVFLFYIIVSFVSMAFLFIGSDLATVAVMTAACIPSVLCLIGMIRGYADARSESGPAGAGIGLYKAGKILGIICLFATAVMGILVLLFSTVFLYDTPAVYDFLLDHAPAEVSMVFGTFQAVVEESGDVFLILAIIAVVFIIIALILAFLYYRSLIKAANAIRDSIASDRRSGHVSLYPAVLMIIAVVIILLGLVSLISSLPFLQGQMAEILGSMDLGIDPEAAVLSMPALILSAVKTALPALQLILGVILIFDLRRRINRI